MLCEQLHSSHISNKRLSRSHRKKYEHIRCQRHALRLGVDSETPKLGGEKA